MRKIIKGFLQTFFGYLAFLRSGNKSILRCNINSFCKFNGKEKFGKNVNFNGCKIFGNGIVHFGDNFHSGKGLVLLTSYHNYNGERIPYDDTMVTKNIVIEDNVWIGLNVTLLGGVTMGEGAIIQAGSVVSQNIPKLGIAGGNPARVFKNRDADKYYRLKSSKQFF